MICGHGPKLHILNIDWAYYIEGDGDPVKIMQEY